MQQFEALKDQIAHVQIAGVPNRHEPNSGSLDYAQVFAMMTASAYQGAIGCEYRPRGSTREGLAWRAEVGAI